MATQQALDKAYMGCAASMAGLSYARRRKVGAVLVAPDGGGIIAEGVNGMPSGSSNDCETVNYARIADVIIPKGYQFKPSELKTKPEVLHAESNAIMKVARSTNSSRGATLYTTLQPCFNCAKLIVQAGIVRVVYGEPYISEHGGDGGLELLKQAGIFVEEYQNDEAQGKTYLH